MKYLNDYINIEQSAVLKKFGAFFAFSNEQFNDQMIKGVKYESKGLGLIVPLGKSKALDNDLDAVYAKGIKQDLKENGVTKIIHRELANRECQITGDYHEVIKILSEYNISADQVHSEYSIFYQDCIDNDCF